MILSKYFKVLELAILGLFSVNHSFIQTITIYINFCG